MEWRRWTWLTGLVTSIVYLQYQRRKHKNKTVGGTVAKGLLLLHPPQHFRDVLVNDILIEESIKQVHEELIVWISGTSSYALELYNQLYDIACLHHKPQLQFRIVTEHEGFVSQEQILLEPALTAVFSLNAAYNAQWHAHRLALHGKNVRALAYHRLSLKVERQLLPHLQYFGDTSTPLALHEKVVLGGTFDHFHNGHRKLLLAAATVCRQLLIVGITSQHMLGKKSHAALIDPFVVRERNVRDYVKGSKPALEMMVEMLEDPFGPSIRVPNIGAIVVSTETIPGALKINQLRQEQGLNVCAIYVLRRTESSTLSSSFLRAQEAQSWF